VTDVSHLVNLIIDLQERVTALEAARDSHDDRIEELENPWKGVSRKKSLERGFQGYAQLNSETALLHGGHGGNTQ
jgi:hypothetical protein